MISTYPIRRYIGSFDQHAGRLVWLAAVVLIGIGGWVPAAESGNPSPQAKAESGAPSPNSHESLDARVPPGTEFALKLRQRLPVGENKPQFHTLLREAAWPAAQTAVIVCDVWDSHHCLNAVRRVQEMAPRMNDFVREARRRGALIIHAPSDCMSSYDGHPARRRALDAPQAANLPPDIGRWCHRIPAEEQGVYPLDQSDGGEDDDPQEHAQWQAKLQSEGRNPKTPWKRQIETIEIRDEDAISDRGAEVWNLLEQRGIQQVMILGVHTNMCVLGRPFGLRQMAQHGKQVVLVRDLTDTMYNPQRWPFVNHHSGTDLIVEHIEKYVCPTITSDQVLGGKPFRFSTDTRTHVAAVLSEDEYQTERTVTEFSRRYLQRDFRLSFFYSDAKNLNSLPGIEQLAEADLAVISVRRRVLPKEQLDVFRRFVAGGKPIVGIRTASHAFAARGNAAPPEGHDVWPEFDAAVLGGNYQGHFGKLKTDGPQTTAWVVPEARSHPVLRGMPAGEFGLASWLYKTQPLGSQATLLMLGRVGADGAREPLAWINSQQAGGRVFYTSLGHPDDFAIPAVRRLLLNGIYWAAGQEPPEVDVEAAPPEPPPQRS
jgi:nicotinamidase-related amidase/type 1 glutamine amidotransferase